MAVEILLQRLYLRLLCQVPTGEQRLKLVNKEIELGRGEGMERYSLGMLARFCKEIDLFTLSETVLDVELGQAKNLDFGPMVHARNHAVHSLEEISQEASGMVIFQTTTLLECLKIVSFDAHEEDKVLSEMPQVTQDELAYLRQRLDMIEAAYGLPVGCDIPTQCKEAFVYAKINPEDALFKLRKILESVVRHIYLKVGLPKTTPLDELISRLREKSLISNRIFKHMDIVKGFGNRGAHPGDEVYRLKDFETVFLSLLNILDWFFDECKEKDAE